MSGIKSENCTVPGSLGDGYDDELHGEAYSTRASQIGSEADGQGGREGRERGRNLIFSWAKDGIN